MSDADPLFDALSSLPAPPEGYTPQDRYRDYRQLFMGSEQGQRVLRDILKQGHLLRPSLTGRPVDPYAVVALEAERNFALRILTAIHDEPKAQPTTQTRKP